MKKLSGFITREQAITLINKHNGMCEQKIMKFGNEYNIHKCILWGDWFEETDCYGNKSQNRFVYDEFTWEQKIN